MPEHQELDDEQRKEIIEIWKTVVGVQQHFNDISMRILLDKKINLNFYYFNLQFATLMPIFGILGTYLFYFIDRYWYHRLLVGAVKHGLSIETKYKLEIPD